MQAARPEAEKTSAGMQLGSVSERRSAGDSGPQRSLIDFTGAGRVVSGAMQKPLSIDHGRDIFGKGVATGSTTDPISMSRMTRRQGAPLTPEEKARAERESHRCQNLDDAE